MAYADSIRQTTATFNEVATLLESHLHKTGGAATTTLINTTSASYVLYTSSEFSLVVATGEKVVLNASVTYSTSAAGNQAYFQLRRNGTGLTYTDRIVRGSQAQTDGTSDTTALHYIDEPGAGTFTYSVYWAVAAGTLYSKVLQYIGHTVRTS